MATPRTIRQSRSRETMHSDCLERPRFSSQRDVANRRVWEHFSRENVAPAPLPSTLNSMLKNTTETGDIGLFSIKPSRYPGAGPRLHLLPQPPLNRRYEDRSLCQDGQISERTFSFTDDRRRLPSYMRDTSSDIVSMFETSSQSHSPYSNHYEQHEPRSSSMTQASHGQFGFPNHRSYSNLKKRANPGVLQRPRSPFAYPTRLRRPGFRPSSPALTDRGIDYSRRAGIQRLPDEFLRTRSCATSYNQWRPYHAPETPLYLDDHQQLYMLPEYGGFPQYNSHDGQTSNDNQLNWASNEVPNVDKIFPVGSTYSAVSTINWRQCRTTRGSPSKAPGTVQSHVPRYYDYTEEFEPKRQVEVPMDFLPAPNFSLQKTIPEDREMSSDWANAKSNEVRFKLPQCLQPSSFNDMALVEIACHDTLLDLDSSGTGKSMTALRSGTNFPFTENLSALGPPNKHLQSQTPMRKRESEALDAKSIPHSINDSPSVVRQDFPRDTSKGFLMTPRNYPVLSHIDGYFETGSKQEAIFEQDNDRQNLPTREMGEKAMGQLQRISTKANQHSENRVMTQTTRVDLRPHLDSRCIRRVVSAQECRVRLSRFDSSDRKPMGPDRMAGESNAMQIQLRDPWPAHKDINWNEDNGRIERHHGLSKYRSEGQLASFDDNVSKEVDSSKSTISRTLNDPIISEAPIYHSSGPLLAPKAISPQRQLKLKNSVPQLMKALPPLPQLPSSPVCLALQTANETLSSLGQPRGRIQNESPDRATLRIDHGSQFSKSQSPLIKSSIPDEPACNHLEHEKLDSTSRTCLSPDSVSPSRQHQLVGTENPPWPDQTLELRTGWYELPSTSHIDSKINCCSTETRLPNNSKDTIRINRSKLSTNTSGSPTFTHGKEAMAGSCAFVDKVSMTRKKTLKETCGGSVEQLPKTPIISQGPPTIIITPTENTADGLGQLLCAVPGYPSSPSRGLVVSVSPTDAQSVFSEDSSQRDTRSEGHRNLHSKLSNLKDHLRVPYGFCSHASRSYDDIFQRNRSEKTAVAAVKQKYCVGMRNRTRFATIVGDAAPAIHVSSRRKLRARIERWLSGAKRVFAGHVDKSRFSDEVPLYAGT